jgi:hypothetical protein
LYITSGTVLAGLIDEQIVTVLIQDNGTKEIGYISGDYDGDIINFYRVGGNFTASGTKSIGNGIDPISVTLLVNNL